MEEIRRYRDTDLWCSRSGKVYKNGREVGRQSRTGYWLISMGSRGSGEKKRNRIIAECWLTYPNQLPDEMEVHHKNEQRDDDRVVNLEVLTKEEHYRKHNKLQPIVKMSLDGRPLKIYSSIKDAETDHPSIEHSHINTVLNHTNTRYDTYAGADWHYYKDRYELVKMMRMADIAEGKGRQF